MEITRRDFFKVSGAAGATSLGLGLGMARPRKALAVDNETDSDATETYDGEACYQEGYDICVNVCAEGSVLLKNADDTLPLAEGTKVTLLGAMSYNYVIGGSGQGADDQDTVMMNDAFAEAGLDVNAEGWDWLAEQCGGSRLVDEKDPGNTEGTSSSSFGASSSSWQGYSTLHEFPASTYESGESALTADGYTDYAIVTVARNGAEGASPSLDFDGDGSTLTGTTYLELGDAEKDLLAFAKKNYAHTILLVNSPNTMELGFVDSDEYNVDACLWIGEPGEAGIVGVGTLLTGRNNPSGRTVDTYAYDVTTNPTYYNTDDNRYANCSTNTGNQAFYQYEEGIYVGYRFFETADAAGYFDSSDFTGHEFKNGTATGYDQVVQYPFGYGLSYTTFDQEIVDSDIALEPHGTNTITVRVTNTGSVAGKDVVQLYLDAPWQSDTDNFGIKGVGLEKSKVVLVAFEKTDELDAGASQDVTLSFDTDDLASYDVFGQGCYVLEQGDYKFNVQRNAHMWGEEGSDNAPEATVTATLDAPVIYDDEGDVSGASYAGARGSDHVVARNVMDEVTAGDGCMLDGYLSRADFAGGMASIMEHTSDEEPNENLRDEAVAALAVTGTDTIDYEFETYVKGEKTTLSKTLYCYGNDMMPFATEFPNGESVDLLEDPLWEQVYYVIEDEEEEDGLPKVVDTEPTSGSYHQLSCDDMAGVTITTDEGLALWEKLTNQTSLSEALEVQGNCGWQVPAVASVGKAAQNCNDGPSEANLGKNAGGTFFPCEVVQSCTWNRSLVQSLGVAHGHQDLLFNVAITYGPGMNTHRSPFGGRNYEYYAEDGVIGGEIGGAFVSGVQSTGVGTFAKHSGCNDGDTNRGGNTTWVSEQAVREIYQRPFEIAVKKYAMNGIMGSMNRVGLSWFHYGFYNTIIRDEWNFNGMLVTDSDGAAGDVYNNAQVALTSQTGMLAFNAYPDDAMTVASFGDATATVLGRYQLHRIMRNALFQYCGTKTVDSEGNSLGGVSTGGAAAGSAGGVPVAGIAGGAVGIAALVGAGVLFARKKKGAPSKAEASAGADAATAAAIEDDEDESQL